MYIFSNHLEKRILERGIKKEWIIETINSFDYKLEIEPSEYHYFKKIYENEKRCLKVVFNPLNNIIVTAYFDRKMTKKGCKNGI